MRQEASGGWVGVAKEWTQKSGANSVHSMNEDQDYQPTAYAGNTFKNSGNLLFLIDLEHGRM